MFTKPSWVSHLERYAFFKQLYEKYFTFLNQSKNQTIYFYISIVSYLACVFGYSNQYFSKGATPSAAVDLKSILGRLITPTCYFLETIFIITVRICFYEVSVHCVPGPVSNPNLQLG